MTSTQPTDDRMFQVQDLKVHFPILGGVLRRPVGWVHAVDGVSFSIRRGETLGIVGESGCGKTTTGRALLRLVKATDGTVLYRPFPQDGGGGPPIDLARPVLRPTDVSLRSVEPRVRALASLLLLVESLLFVAIPLTLAIVLAVLASRPVTALIVAVIAIVLGIFAFIVRREPSAQIRRLPAVGFVSFAVLVVVGILIGTVPGFVVFVLVTIASAGALRHLYWPDVDVILGDSVRKLRRRIQIIFQDPSSSLDPRQLVKSIVAEPSKVHRLTALKCTRCGELVPVHRERRGAPCASCGGPTEPVPLRGLDLETRVLELLDRVGMNPEHMFRFPHEFSGGQKQRIAITRALSLNPDFLVLDEPTSALDVSVQAQILNLLKDLQREYRLTYLFISHNLSVVRHMADRISVMYLGKFIEVSHRKGLFDNPLHPYTKSLLEVIPIPDPSRRRELARVKGEVPSPVNPPLGCRFHPRCLVAMPHCGWESRDLQKVLEEASRVGAESAPLAGSVKAMTDDGFLLRIHVAGDPEGSVAAIQKFLDDGRARELPMYEAIESVAREGPDVLVRFREAKEPELKEVEPGHAVACYLY